MTRKLNVVFLDTTLAYGYRFSATNTKTEFMARGLLESGASVVIINSVVGCSCVNKRTLTNQNGLCNVITYPKKNNQLISWTRNLSDLSHDLQSLYVSNAQNIVVLEAPDFHIYKVYCYYAHKYGYKIVTISHEWLPTVKTAHPLRRPFRYLYTKFFGDYSDGILPISEYIIEKIKHFNKPFLKVPVLAGYDGICKNENKGNYYLYCVYATYTRVIFPLVEAFGEFVLKSGSNSKLLLVLGGEEEKIKAIENYIKDKGYEGVVETRSKIPYTELVDMYRRALGLIIPLDPNSEQDHARFSQKIAEYTSSGSPIISCKVGEVDYYFKDKESIVFSDYSKSGFVDAFTWIADHPKGAAEIGKRGYEVGKRYFNYKLVGKQLYDFLMQI